MCLLTAHDSKSYKTGYENLSFIKDQTQCQFWEREAAFKQPKICRAFLMTLSVTWQENTIKDDKKNSPSLPSPTQHWSWTGTLAHRAYSGAAATVRSGWGRHIRRSLLCFRGYVESDRFFFKLSREWQWWGWILLNHMEEKIMNGTLLIWEVGRVSRRLRKWEDHPWHSKYDVVETSLYRELVPQETNCVILRKSPYLLFIKWSLH